MSSLSTFRSEVTDTARSGLTTGRSSWRTGRSSKTGRSVSTTNRTDLTASIESLQRRKAEIEAKLRQVDQQLMLSLPSAKPYKPNRPFANYPTTYRMEEQLGSISERSSESNTARSRLSARKAGSAALTKTRPW
jgi:hypothetical protein